MLNSDCHRSCVGLLMNRDVRILLVPQTILHDRSYSASECVCSCYKHKIINIKYISITTTQQLKFLLNSEHDLTAVWLIQNFRISPSLSNWIELESSDSNSNRISKLRRSLGESYVSLRLRLLFISKETILCLDITGRGLHLQTCRINEHSLP